MIVDRYFQNFADHSDPLVVDHLVCYLAYFVVLYYCQSLAVQRCYCLVYFLHYYQRRLENFVCFLAVLVVFLLLLNLSLIHI